MLGGRGGSYMPGGRGGSSMRGCLGRGRLIPAGEVGAGSSMLEERGRPAVRGGLQRGGASSDLLSGGWLADYVGGLAGWLAEWLGWLAV